MLISHTDFFRKIGLLALLSGLMSPSYAQKPSIDSRAYQNWPQVRSPKISNDGKYILFTEDNVPAGSSTLIVKGTQNSWEKDIPSASSDNAVFTGSGKVIYLKQADSLCIMTLGTDKVEAIAGVGTFKVPKIAHFDWFAYQIKSPAGTIVLRNITTGESRLYQEIMDYSFSDNGTTLLLKKGGKKDGVNTERLLWIDLVNGKTATIWNGQKSGQFKFDNSGTGLTFLTQGTKENYPDNAIWYYKTGMDTARLIVNGESKGIKQTLEIVNRRLFFSKDGDRIFFSLKPKTNPSQSQRTVSPDVWNYKDSMLQSQQLVNSKISNFIAAVVNLHSNQIFQLTNDGEKVISLPDVENDSFVLVSDDRIAFTEWYWNKKNRPLISLVSTINEHRTKLNLDGSQTFRLSLGGKYVIYYVPGEKNYFSYEISTGITRNITKGISTVWTFNNQMPNDDDSPIFSLTWLQGDSSVLICDRNDIWQVDPKGMVPAKNITHWYGRKYNIEFRLADDRSRNPVRTNERLILQAYNKTNKDYGFYSIVVGNFRRPEKLTMGKYAYAYSDIEHFPFIEKARDTGIYLVRRMSATEAPNYYLTTDFIKFKQVSDVNPEKHYNWMRSKLVTWTKPDGKKSDGILYLPENFDSKKKYPMVFYFYERLSNELNEFKIPQEEGAIINIPFYASNGYLVFEPDIEYQVGNPCQSVCNSVVSIAKYFSKKPWVSKMGIQGHSFGGYEVNCLITHTNLFTAAASGSGICDLISLYGGTAFGGKSDEFIEENAQGRIGATLWKRPDLYIKNSPIFKVNQITTPLFIMANKADDNVPFAQGIELFTAMRRLGKPAWLLQYDEEGHIILRKKNREDYTLRLKQFFDHYLKGAPAPKWMTEGIPASKKGIEQGYELEPKGVDPVPGVTSEQAGKK